MMMTAEVAPAPYSAPEPDQLVVRIQAVAVNPLDWLIQVAGSAQKVVINLRPEDPWP